MTVFFLVNIYIRLNYVCINVNFMEGMYRKRASTLRKSKQILRLTNMQIKIKIHRLQDNIMNCNFYTDHQSDYNYVTPDCKPSQMIVHILFVK